MALTLLSTLLARLTMVPDATTQIRQQFLAVSAQEFCRDSGVWRETISDVALVAAQVLYPITIPTDGGTAYECDAPLDVLSIERRNTDDELVRTFGKSEYTIGADGVITFETAPLATGQTTADTLTYDLTWLPQVDVTRLPAWLMTRWSEAIAMLANAKLMPMYACNKGQIEYGGECRVQYEFLKGQAKVEGWRGRQNGPMSIEIPQFI